MSYGDRLSAVFGKRPIWLYHLTKDGFERFFTSRATDYTENLDDWFDQVDVYAGDDWSTRTWVSVPIAHTRFRVTSSIGRAETEVLFPQSNEWVQTYVAPGGLGYEDNTITVYHEFVNDPDSERVAKYRGRAVATRRKLNFTYLVCENRFTELRRKGLSAVVQRPCRHALYHSKDGLGCNLNIEDFQTDGTMTALSDTSATVTEAGDQDDTYFAGGVLTFNGARQLILSHTGTTLVLLGPVPGLQDEIDANGTASVQIAPGCNLTRATCAEKFNNLENFGGFPWIDDNPFSGRTIY